MPKFKVTLKKEFSVDTAEWDDDDDDNWLTENLKAMNVDPANATRAQLEKAMRECLADDLEEVVDFDEIVSDDFTVELAEPGRA